MNRGTPSDHFADGLLLVIGGSMMKKIGIPIDATKSYLRGMLHIYPELPEIIHSALGDVGGIHGALTYVRQRLTQGDKGVRL